MQARGRDRQQHGSVQQSGVLEGADGYCKDMLSVHVFAVADDLKSDEGERDDDVLDDAMRYYVVALQKDGRTMLVWHVKLTGDGYVTQVGGQL